MKKKLVSMLVMVSMLIGNVGLVHAQATEENAAPVLSGTCYAEVKKGAEFNLQTSLYRVQATDYEDGDLNRTIELDASQIDTSQVGTHTIAYQVEDSAGEKVNMTATIDVVDTDYEFGERIQKVLYTKESAEHLTQVGLYRGYYHDRQHLGIYLKEGAQLFVRIANWESYQNNLTLEILADDSAIEKTYTIPAGGNWLEVPASDVTADMVPFVKTPEADIQPIIEYYFDDKTMEPLTYYSYGDSQDEFFAEWEMNGHEYALIEGERIMMLVPRCDKEQILGNTSTIEEYRFETIDEMLDYYKDVQEQYDAYAGLYYTTDKSIDKNVRGKYFLKADATGVGAAYYSAYEYIAENSESIKGYLKKDWMSLHEVAHGYDTTIASGNLPLVETINNILGHYYEKKILVAGDNGWSGLQDLGSCEELYIGQLKQGMTFEEMQFDARLYCMLNLLKGLDAQKMMSELHHAWRETTQRTNTIDFIVEQFSESSGYNLVPYFEEYGIQVSELVKSRIFEKGYPILEHFADCFASEADAVNARESVAEEVTGLYGLASLDTLKTTGAEGRLEIQIKIDNINQLLKQKIVLMDGTKIAATQTITAEEVVFENIPIGRYCVVLPATCDLGYYSEYVSAVVKKDAATQLEVEYLKVQDNLLRDDIEIHLKGLGEGIFSILSTDAENQKVIVETKNMQPHYIFNDTYAKVEVVSPEGTLLYEKVYIGTTNYDANIEEIGAPVGTIIKIQHKELYHSEAGSRLKVYSKASRQECTDYTKDVKPNDIEMVFLVTENGLKRIDWTEEEFEEVRYNMYASYAGILDESLTLEEKTDRKAYQKQKAQIVSAVCSLREDAQEYFIETYEYFFQENNFIDVTQADYYYYPVRWAFQNGITSGVSLERFEPEEGCTRGQVVTFLWRAAGAPEPKQTSCPFKDVNEKAYYSKAVLWAVENDITTGIGPDRFAPDHECTRGQIVTFLWRASGQREPETTQCNFVDVLEEEYYREAVLWAVENNITSGVSSERFSPNTVCTRGQIVTFLYRAE